MDRTLCRLAVAAGLVAALGLGACGRKGALDPPPGAAVDPAPAQRTSGLAVLRPGQPRQPAARPADTVEQSFDEDGNPIAPRGQKKTFPLDPLLD